MAHPDILALNERIQYTARPDGYHQAANLWGDATLTLGSSSFAQVDPPDTVLFIRFQDGPIQKHGVNGVGIENVLEVCRTRLQMFQDGPFNCSENATALRHIELAISALALRTARRIDAGVEGTDRPHKS